MKKTTILVAGSLNMDFMMRVEHLAQSGETVLSPRYTLSPGGKGANQAVACARAGGTVAMLGAVGRDVYGESLRSSLHSSGVDTQYLLEVTDHTGAAFIGVAADGENSILVASGANLALHPQHLPDLSRVSHLLLQLESPMVSVLSYAKRAHQEGIPVILNAAPARPLEPGLLGCVHTLIMNEGELEHLTQTSLEAPGTALTVLAKARALVKQGPRVVIVTLGSQGCIAYTAEGTTLAVPSLPVEVVDTTGAGDTFVGILVAYLARGVGLAQALHAANAGAALACTRAGAQPSMPSLLEIEAFLK